MKLKVIDLKGKDTGRKVSLPTKIFDIEPNNQAIYLDIKAQMANKRQGTHKAKERSEITGSNRKIKKQKGTGSARAGSIKNPIFRGGGRIFGPQVRDYSQKLNKKQKILARKSALSIKAKSNFWEAKHKEYVPIFKTIKNRYKKFTSDICGGK